MALKKSRTTSLTLKLNQSFKTKPEICFFFFSKQKDIWSSKHRAIFVKRDMLNFCKVSPYTSFLGMKTNKTHKQTNKWLTQVCTHLGAHALTKSHFSFASFVKQLKGHHEQSIRGTKDRFKCYELLKGY